MSSPLTRRSRLSAATRHFSRGSAQRRSSAPVDRSGERGVSAAGRASQGRARVQAGRERRRRWQAGGWRGLSPRFGRRAPASASMTPHTLAESSLSRDKCPANVLRASVRSLWPRHCRVRHLLAETAATGALQDARALGSVQEHAGRVRSRVHPCAILRRAVALTRLRASR